ncbi:IS5 family transposase [Streptomyces sp. NPDC005820]|uniref:IS5 family transposase n=1 Tax=Streptomyces sp. NPDC005820 TaxID=3157069 RepID=UPI00340E0254
MTDAERAEVRPAMPVPAWLLRRGRRPQAYCHREILDDVRYLADNGVKWTAMPVDFPYRRALYDFFRRRRSYDYVRELYERLRRSARERSGRSAEPGAAIIDSQSVDASETVGEDSRGYDGGTSRDGRKSQILTDTEGLLLEVTVTTADVHDSKAAPALLETFMDQPGRLLRLVWVDSAYQGPAPAKAFARHGVRIEIVRRSDGQRGFVVLARRWVVERTLSRLARSRRLNRDHERRPDHHRQMVWWAAVIRLSRRLAADAPRWPEKRSGRLPRARA